MTSTFVTLQNISYLKNANIVNCHVVKEMLFLLNRSPHLQITLKLMKQYIKTFNEDGECFNYTIRVFPKLSTEKQMLIFLIVLRSENEYIIQIFINYLTVVEIYA